MHKWCKHPDDDSHCPAKPKFRPRTGLPKTKTAKVPMCKTNIWVYSLQCLCIFQPNQVDTAQDASKASVIHTSWSEFCAGLHTVAALLQAELENPSLTWITRFRRTLAMLDFRLKQHLPFLIFLIGEETDFGWDYSLQSQFQMSSQNNTLHDLSWIFSQLLNLHIYIYTTNT